MRNLIALTLGILSLCYAHNSLFAQESAGSPSIESDTCVYKLELTEEMIQDLRNGATFHSEIPAEWRNKVTHVELKIVQSQHSAGFATKQEQGGGMFLGNQNSAVRQLNPTLPSNSTGQNFSGSQNPSSFPANNPPGFQNNTRTDSLSPQPSPTNVIPSSTLPPSSLFNATPPNTGSPNPTASNPTPNGGIPNSVLSSTTSSLNPGVSRYEQPIGPPIPNSMPVSNSPQSNALTLPPMNPNGFQPAQPNNTELGFSSNSQSRGNIPSNQNGFSNAPNFTAETTNSNSSGWRPPLQPQTTSRDQFGMQTSSNPPPWKQSNQLTDQLNQGKSDGNRLVGFEQPRQSNIPGYDLPQVQQQPPRVALAPVSQPVTLPPSQELQITNPPLIATNTAAPQITEAVSEEVNEPSPVAQLNQFNSFLYFLLLCSIGLNLYLGWISRGFYGRYRELADELRDAFSTSM